MSIAHIDSVLQNLKCGVIETSDLEWLDHLSGQEVLSELAAQFPVKFLESRRGDKTEIGLAQTHRRSLYRPCLILTSEAGRVTTLAMMTSLRVRRPRQPAEPYQFVSGGGFSLYRDPDGWKLKLLHERTVSMPDGLIQKHGWVIG